jgi:hypothetical protein
LDYDDAAILLGLLLGKYAVRSCNIDRDRARTIAFSKGGHPGKVLEVRWSCSTVLSCMLSAAKCLSSLLLPLPLGE